MRADVWRWIGRGGGFGVGFLVVLAMAFGVAGSAHVVVLVLVSILLAAALDPITYLVRRRAPRISRAVTVLAVYVLFIVAVAALMLLVVPAAVDQLGDLSARAPRLLADLRASLETLEPEAFGTAAARFVRTLEVTFFQEGLADPDPDLLIRAGLTVADAAISVITVLSLTFFWLVGREPMQRFMLALLPPDRRGGVREAWNEVESRLGLWVRGQLTLMTVIGVATTIAYFLLGLENAVLLGLIAGLAEIIPIVGPAIGAVPALISAAITGGPELALLVAGVYIVIQVVEGNILVPWVMRNAVGLPPFVVIVSLLVGAAVAGLVGALLAIPVAAAGVVVLERAQVRETPVRLQATEAEDESDTERDAGEEGRTVSEVEAPATDA